MSRFGKPDGTTKHEYYEERLSAYLDGELAPGERETVERHLTTCQACQWDLDTLQTTVQWMGELPTVPLPRVFTIPAPAQPERTPWRRCRRPNGNPFAIDAGCAASKSWKTRTAGTFISPPLPASFTKSPTVSA